MSSDAIRQDNFIPASNPAALPAAVRSGDAVPAARDRFGYDSGRIEYLGEFVSPEKLYQDLIERVGRYHPSDDISLIEKAFKTAREAHEGQVRRSGVPSLLDLPPTSTPEHPSRSSQAPS